MSPIGSRKRSRQDLETGTAGAPRFVLPIGARRMPQHADDHLVKRDDEVSSKARVSTMECSEGRLGAVKRFVCCIILDGMNSDIEPRDLETFAWLLSELHECLTVRNATKLVMQLVQRHTGYEDRDMGLSLMRIYRVLNP